MKILSGLSLQLLSHFQQKNDPSFSILSKIAKIHAWEKLKLYKILTQIFSDLNYIEQF